MFIYTRGSQPFWARGTLIWWKKFGCTPKCKKDQKSTVFIYLPGYFNIWRHIQNNFTAHSCVAAPRLRNTDLIQSFIVSYFRPILFLWRHVMFLQRFVSCDRSSTKKIPAQTFDRQRKINNFFLSSWQKLQKLLNLTTLSYFRCI